MKARAAACRKFRVSDIFVTAVEEIYRAATEPSRWPKALQAIADCVEDIGAILIYVKDDGTFGVLNSHSLDDIIEEYGKYWNAHDLRAVRARERGYFLNRDIITDRDILSEEEMKTEPFYADFLARYGLKYFAAVMVSPDARIEVAVSVQRAIGKPAYSESELALLARLGPHIERSLRLSIRLMDSELSKLGLGAALARVGIGVFVLDSVGRVLFSNPAAQAMLGDGLELIDNKLTARSTATNVQALDAIKQIVRRKPDDWLNEIKPILIQRRSSPRPLALSILPIPVATSAPEPAPGSGARERPRHRSRSRQCGRSVAYP